MNKIDRADPTMNSLQGADAVQRIQIKASLQATNSAIAPLFNMSMVFAMLYTLIEDQDPVTAYALHQSKAPTPWSFSTLHFDRGYQKTPRKGFYQFPKGITASWHVNTTNASLTRALVKNQRMRLGDLQLKITQLEVTDKRRERYEAGTRALTIKLHTPTVFYRASEKQYYPLDEAAILNWQLHKLHQLGLVGAFDATALLPYIRILHRDTRKRAGHIRLPHNKQLIRIEGDVGSLHIKLNGEEPLRQYFWNIFHIGQFIGMGSGSSKGFGHYSIQSR